MQQVIQTLEAERAEVQERLAWIEKQIDEFRERHGHEAAPVPARSTRRATARRASSRRATARQRQGDTKSKIVAYLETHPGSTAGDVAKGLDLSRNSTSTRLSQMVKAGEIVKATKGYTTK
jgi:CRP-like cAMP-binding protein